MIARSPVLPKDRKSTRLNSSHTVIYTLSLHDALPISAPQTTMRPDQLLVGQHLAGHWVDRADDRQVAGIAERSEEHTSELQSHSDLHSFPTRRSSDLSPPDHHATRPAPRRTAPRRSLGRSG